jgi:hypothetical protein
MKPALSVISKAWSWSPFQVMVPLEINVSESRVSNVAGFDGSPV